jgi:hypothetical protein
VRWFLLLNEKDREGKPGKAGAPEKSLRRIKEDIGKEV